MPRRPARRHTPYLLAALTSLALGLPATAGAADAAFTQLMQRFASRPHGRATFVERQYVAVLKEPLESSGELYFEAPAHLEKRTLRPRPEFLLVDNGMLTIRRGSRQYSVALAAYPQIGPFIDSIRATLAGDQAALEQVYAVEFVSGEHGWTIALTPRDAKLVALVSGIRLSGAGDELNSVEIRRADGDRSVMTITPIKTS